MLWGCSTTTDPITDSILTLGSVAKSVILDQNPEKNGQKFGSLTSPRQYAVHPSLSSSTSQPDLGPDVLLTTRW